MRRSYNLVLLLLLTLCACSNATDPFEAYQKGNYKTAIKGLSRLADKGNANALTHLGVIYHMGLDVDRDLEKSFMYYQQAAKQNYAPAQYNLGLMHQSGLGTKQDYETAYKYFLLAADQDHHKAKLAAEILIIELRVR